MSIAPRCPTCRKTVRWEANPFRPFCSERCRTLDLGGWAAERYRIPGEPVPSESQPGSESSSPPASPTKTGSAAASPPKPRTDEK